MRNNQIKIIVGMSGGVDSSVAALLLRQQGYNIEGVFMKNWEADDDDSYCQADIDLTDARAVCNILNIPLHTVNFSREYWDHVFQYFLDEYAKGFTPNPDVICNKEIKFKAFLNYAIDLGADFIATGHYARTMKNDGKYQLLKGRDTNKDQTYFLYALNQHPLAHSIFPLGELKKINVRRLAKKAGFPNHQKTDSTGICFIGERKFKEFLNEYLLAQPGNIETPEGEIIGHHEGLMFYTIGQRQGIGIGGLKGAEEAPWFVLGKNLKRNALIVGQGHDHPLLFKSDLHCQQVNWIYESPASDSFHCKAKIRYRQQEQSCVVNKITENNFNVKFDSPQRAITPGQSIVFYDHDICLGGGIIL